MLAIICASQLGFSGAVGLPGWGGTSYVIHFMVTGLVLRFHPAKKPLPLSASVSASWPETRTPSFSLMTMFEAPMPL